MTRNARVATLDGSFLAWDYITDTPTTVDVDVTWAGRGDYTATIQGGSWVQPDGTRIQSRSAEASWSRSVAHGVVDGFDLDSARAKTKGFGTYLLMEEVRHVL